MLGLFTWDDDSSTTFDDESTVEIHGIIKELNVDEYNLTMFPLLSVHSRKEYYFHLVGLKVA